MIKHTARKTVYAVLLIFSTACLISGCKKNREKIDLDSVHTSAVETMAETTGGTAASSEAADITLEAAVENAANANTSPTEGNGAGAGSTVANLNTEIQTCKEGNISIQYPSVKNFDADKTAALDSLLKDNALSVLTGLNVDTAKDSLEISCKVLSADRNRITVTYTGTVTAAGAAHPTNLFYSNTVDVNKVSSLGFTHYADPSAMAAYVLSDDCVLYQADAAVKSAFQKEVRQHNADYYRSLFQNADFPCDGSFPSSFSYEYEGDIYFTVPVSHALGDYVIVVYTPESK